MKLCHAFLGYTVQDSSTEFDSRPPNSATSVPSDVAATAEDLAHIEQRIEQTSDVLASLKGDALSQENIRPFQLDQLAGKPTSVNPDAEATQPIEILSDVELDLRIELGRTEMSLKEILQLRNGSVVALNELIGDPCNVYVNGRIVARGEILVMDDNFCVRVTELVGAA